MQPFYFLVRPDPAAAAAVDEDLGKYLSVLPPVMLRDYGGVGFDDRGKRKGSFCGASGHSYSQHPYLGEAIMNRDGHHNRSEAFFLHWSTVWPEWCSLLRQKYFPTSPLAVQSSDQGEWNPKLTHLILENGLVIPLDSPTRVWSAQEQGGWEPVLLRKPPFNDGEYKGAYSSYCPYVAVENILIDSALNVSEKHPIGFLVHPWLGDLSRNWLGDISETTLNQVAVRWVKVCQATAKSEFHYWPTPLLIHTFDGRQVWIVSPAGEIEEYVLPVN